MHGHHCCDAFEKFRFTLPEERDWLAVVVQDLCIKQVHELSELISLILMEHSQDLLGGLVPKPSIVDHQFPQDYSDLERVFVAEVPHSVHELVKALGRGGVQAPIETVVLVAISQLKQAGNQLARREIVHVLHVEQDLIS